MSFSYFINLLHVPPATIKIVRDLRMQKRFIVDQFQPIVSEFKAQNGLMAEIDCNRITNYYALAVPAIIGEVHCTLHHKAMTNDERSAGTLMGACSVLFDDFFDNDNLSDEYIAQLIDNPEHAEPYNDSVKLAIQLYVKLLGGVKCPSSIQQALNAVFREQIRSRKQKEMGIAEGEIKDITFAKGGTAFLLYRKAFGEISTRAEVRFYHAVGAIMQLENDIFDVYKDREARIKTLVTTSTDIKIVRNLYLYLIKEMFDVVHQLLFSPQVVAKAMRILMLIVCRGFVCLDQLEKLQKTTSNRFELMTYSRSELICDMEKPANFLKTIHYYAKFQY